VFSQKNINPAKAKLSIPYSFFERVAIAKAERTIAKSKIPSMINGILKAGSEWKTAVVGRPAR